MDLFSELFDYIKPERISKGKSLIALPDDFVVIDVETTGLDATFDSLIEISAIRVQHDEEVSRFSSLIAADHPISSFIEQLTGITNEMLASAPPVSDVLAEFFDFIGDSILVGHNVNFDINFIYDHAMDCLGKPLTNDFVDVMRLCRNLFKDWEHHTLAYVCEKFHVDHSTAHRSMADCIATLECYHHIKDHVRENNIDLAELLKKNHRQFSAKDVVASTDTFDPTHPLYRKNCVFTGTLEKMSRKEAMQIVVDLGGICQDSITGKTNFLIMGNTDYSKVKDGKSKKMQKAEKYILAGKDITILSENVFWDLIEQV